MRHPALQPDRRRHRQVASAPPGARGAEGQEPERLLHLRLRVPLAAAYQQQLQPEEQQPVILRHPEKLPIGRRIDDLVKVLILPYCILTGK